MRLTWVQPEDLLPHELVQCAAEEIDVDDLRERWVAAGGDPAPAVSGASPTPAGPELRQLARVLLDEAGERYGAATYEAVDVPSTDSAPATDVSSARLADRIEGAWIGRAAGCLAGKVVEKIPRQGIAQILRSSGQWPMRDYITAVGVPADVRAAWPWNRRSAPTSLRENIAGMPEDDDLNFAILALDLTERCGADLTTEDVATAWLDQLPAGRVFTAERVAYRNLLEGLTPPATATTRNPFREWIGAQIRTDVYGWTRPGRPAEAARLAFVDARLSHTRNGIYGARWVAAMGAITLVADDPVTVVTAALAVVPADCALADAVRFGLAVARDQRDEGFDLDSALDRLHARYGGLHWVHSLNNSALTAYALAAGGGDFTATVAAAVCGGWDTDSVGATVGGVCGALLGGDGIPAHWVRPVQDRVASSLPGADGLSLSGLAARTAALAAA